ncbi:MULTISPECIES: cobaltochelatase subunit CobN [unclassified Ruegeria]|uniref:cobaltochelatase subunit CobN n=1 Tax=unclassified Ruegeria TaxID=2625375 RepID=UPI001493228C|nr:MULTISPECIES: cobaltochelatase subunit CobN [unclassified Ruegeria]NOD87911.1 cobaltochelatase subunit CobN [Ruegeria sp. HKCCD4318]NOE14281.1 cobaltochelatase subunit CobN [Ruegeria sp. HKCCD4318-2]NOG08362.1 cobaltochelatase subunit CobN [Ruegeria sp. HKCCD4315]
MHVVFRESHGLEETETPTDLGQSPADLVVLSFSDSDLGAFAAGWHRGGGTEGRMPTLRLANLTALKHPLSVDTYVEQTLDGAKGILIRLIGGVPYWSYGLQQVLALAQAKGIALAILPADGREDTRLDDYSTLPVSTLRRLAHLCDTGGEVAAQAALAQMALAAGLYAGPVMGAKTLPECGAWCPDRGVIPTDTAFEGDAKRIVVTFYRAYLTSADTAPVAALIRSLRARGFAAVGLFAPSLKAPTAADWLRETLGALTPAAIINATSFSGKGASGTSPLDAANVPVFQVALATSRRKAWAEAERGLSPADLAMHVVLPEVDGRISAGIASFKEPGKRDPHLEYSRFAHRAEAERIEAIIDRVSGWLHLNDKPKADQIPALVLSTYPGKDWQMAHAVGLDALASAEAMLCDLQNEGYDTAPAEPIAETLLDARISWPLDEYLQALTDLPEQLRTDLQTVWGKCEDDPAFADGAFHFTALRRGQALVALQPERGTPELRDDDYHDLSRTPRHSYVAFYLWLRKGLGADALIHIGAHGTLEWLPGKSVALSADCWPEALIRDLPVIYPFIVNDPGEAAQAKRRIGAVTLGHIPPPMKESGTPDRMVRLESLLDEFSNADGLDPKRRDRLQEDIRDEAQAIGLENDLGLDQATCTAEAITRIDRFVCDIKESQFGDGLHIFGRVPEVTGNFDPTASAHAERSALIDALAGKRIEAGQSGSPYRGRSDVLPTGRNLYTTDPRSVPTRAAYAQGVKLAEELVRRHLQEEGDYPKGLIVDLWGSATMRTAGEEFAMALHLLGVKPVWDKGSERVSGVEVLPITDLSRPRLDVTLRVSGLFRDVFPTLSALYGQAVRALSARDEAPDWNPYAGLAPTARVYGPAPGSYGVNMTQLSEVYTDEARAQAGEAWLEASSFALEGEHIAQDKDGITQRVANADSFVHLQDLTETDLLLANDYATHEAGFAAAKKITGGSVQLYHLDNTNPETPRARTLPEEISRVVHARAANPNWIAGMQRHGFRGAAEIAATLDHMASFAHLSGTVAPHLFDLYHDATLGNEEVDTFLQEANPLAHQAMQDRFRALLEAGLWNTRRNSIRADLEGLT